MKKLLSVSSAVFVVTYTLAIAAQFAGLVSFNVFGVPALIGGLAAAGFVGSVLSDYSRRPSFRVRSPRRTIAAIETSATPPSQDPATMWTYTTRSV